MVKRSVRSLSPDKRIIYYRNLAQRIVMELCIVDLPKNMFDNLAINEACFEAVKQKASAITPVPGGGGPMTITMLMMNTVRAAKLAAGLA